MKTLLSLLLTLSIGGAGFTLAPRTNSAAVVAVVLTAVVSLVALDSSLPDCDEECQENFPSYDGPLRGGR